MSRQRADATTAVRRGVLVAAALLAAGVAGAVDEPDGYRMDDYRAPVPDSVHGGTVVHTGALKQLVDRGAVLLVDVLPAPRRPPGSKPGTPWLPVPREDLPGSAWLPDVGRGALRPAMERWFRAQLTELTGGAMARPIVFYCLKDCWMSWNAAKRAVSYGYTNVLWYPDGTDGWQAAGLPLVEATARTLPE